MLLSQVSIHSWINENKIKTESGQELDFHNHRYLFDIYADRSKYLCCIKAGQIGFSTMAILKTIWLARNLHIDVGYILPTVEMVQKFVGSKVNRMSQQNPIIQEWMKDKDSITQKQIDENYIFYLGAQTDRSAIMLSLDMLVADEYDKAPQEILEIYDSRLQHSKHGYKWVFSNPTLPDFGVDRFWAISDKKMWHVKHACGETFVLDESCIDYAKEIFACPTCKGEITDEERRMGEWMATIHGIDTGMTFEGIKIEKDVKWSGYWIPLWINPLVSAAVICDHKKTKTPEYFANFVAGLPYINASNQVTQNALEKCLTDKLNEQKGRLVLGMDTGHNIHYTIANADGFFYHGYCMSIAENEASANPKKNYDPYDEIDNLLATYPKLMVIADQGGDLIGIRKLQAKYPGRVYLCWFTKETRNQEIIRWVDEEDGRKVFKVLVDRNRQIQLLVDEIYDRRVTFNGSLEEWQPYFDHWENIYRVKEIKGDANDPQYGWRWVWKRKGPDHWALSGVYTRIGLDRFIGDMAQIIKKDEFMSGVHIGSNVDGTIRAASNLRRFGSFNSNGGTTDDF